MSIHRILIVMVFVFAALLSHWARADDGGGGDDGSATIGDAGGGNGGIGDGGGGDATLTKGQCDRKLTASSLHPSPSDDADRRWCLMRYDRQYHPRPIWQSASSPAKAVPPAKSKE